MRMGKPYAIWAHFAIGGRWVSCVYKDGFATAEEAFAECDRLHARIGLDNLWDVRARDRDGAMRVVPRPAEAKA